MQLKSYKLHLTDHAYKQYCKRVRQINRQYLKCIIRDQLAAGAERIDQYLKLGDIWWIVKTSNGYLIMITCYGRYDLDLPSAINWCRRNGDRVNIGV